MHGTDGKALIGEFHETSHPETTVALAYFKREKREKRSRWSGWDPVQGFSSYIVTFPGLSPELQGLTGGWRG